MNPIKEMIIQDGKEYILPIPARSINTITQIYLSHEEFAKTK
jgi:hypothetical protein